MLEQSSKTKKRELNSVKYGNHFIPFVLQERKRLNCCGAPPLLFPNDYIPALCLSEKDSIVQAVGQKGHKILVFR